MSNLVKTPERLKLSILNYALSGKLTKQLPSDGDAHKLVHNILNKKQGLIKSHKIRKHRKLPVIVKNEIPFNIPSNWCWTRFSSLYDMIGGSQPPKATFINHQEDGYIRLYQTRDYGSNPKPVFIPKNKARKISHENDILVARYGGSLGEIFRAHYGAYNVALAKVTPVILHHELNINFIWYYLRSNFYQKFVRTLNKSAQAGFNKTDLTKLLLPVPPLSEQHRIVQRLNEILPKVDDLNKDVVKLNSIRTKFPHRLKQSLLLEAMKGHLTQQLPSDGNADDLLETIKLKQNNIIKKCHFRRRPSLPTINKCPYKIPNNWEWVRLCNISIIRSGKRVPRGMKLSNIKIKGSEPYLRVKDMKNFSVNINTLKYATQPIINKINKYRIYSTDIYITVAGSLGKVGLIPNKLNGILLTENANRIIPINMDKYYLLYVLSSSFIKSQIELVSHRVAQPKLSIKKLRGFKIPLPPLPEQHRIVSKLNNLFNIIND